MGGTVLKFEFLKAINDYVKIYKSFPLPAIICDTSFAVYWSNSLAKGLYPSLSDTEGLEQILGELDTTELLDQLRKEGSCTISGLMFTSDVNLSFLPILGADGIVGIVLLLISAESTPTADTAIQASKTADALDSCIRQIVDDMFSAMDATALKADLLKMSWIKPSLNTIGLGGYHILRVIGNASEYAKFRGGGQSPRLVALNLCELLRSVEPTVSEIGKTMGIPVSFEFPDIPCILRADQALLELAVSNLLHNSFYFTRPGNAVTITVTQNDHYAFLTVEDRGVGIPLKLQHDIFRPYVVHSNNHKGAGIGLGLALVKAVMRAHNGAVEIHSRPGEGTRAVLRLPLAGGNTPLSLRQNDPVQLSDRFNGLYIGLMDAAESPYRV